MFKHQILAEPPRLRFTKSFNSDPLIIPTNDGTAGNKENFNEGIAPTGLTSWVIYLSKMCYKTYAHRLFEARLTLVLTLEKPW